MDASTNIESTSLLQKVKQFYENYPRLSQAFVISAIVHAIIIFYMPPEWLTLMMGPPGDAAKKQRPIKLTLKGDLSDTPSDSQGEKEGEGKGKFPGAENGKWSDLIQRLQDNAKLAEGFPQKYEDLYSDGRVSEAYIYRDRKHEDIVVKEVFPTIYTIDKPFKEILAASPKVLDEYIERNEVIKEFRDWEQGKSNNVIKLNISEKKGKTNKGPLDFPKPKRSQYFDETLTQGKEAQLSNFIRQYFSYDPDKGDLPIATRELYYDNLQRLAYPFSSDPSFFTLDYYLENLNKEDFLNHSIYQAAKLEGTKTQTELLFAIQDIYTIQQRAWYQYFSFDSQYKRLSDERKTRLRNETLKRVGERYKDILKEKDIKSYQDIRELYIKKRLEIIDYIIATTPDAYRLNDAIFEKAAIQWEHGKETRNMESLNSAIEGWMSLLSTSDNPKEFINAGALQKLSPLLHAYRAASNPITQRTLETKIDQILRFRHQERLQAKREREEKILWPKNAAAK